MEIYRNIQAHGSLPEYANDGDPHDRYYLPARSLTMNIRSPEDVVVLPEHDSVVSYAHQLSNIVTSLNRPSLDPVFIPDTDYLLDVAIAEHVDTIQERLRESNSYRVMPYSITQHTLEWINHLRSEGFSVSAGNDVRVYYEDLMNPSHRGGWGRHVSNPDRLSFPERHNIPYPASWIATDATEISEAYQRVAESSGSSDVFFKPVFSAGGFTIRRVSSVSEANEYYAELEEHGALSICNGVTPIEMQESLTIAPNQLFSLQYDGSCIDTPGTVCRQVVDGVNWAGNIFNESHDHHVEARDIFSRIVQGHRCENIPMNGNGGIDFARVQDRFVVLEQNGRRITGAHPAIALAEGFGVDNQAFMNTKAPGEVSCDLQTVWRVLECEGFAYDPALRSGIFPIVWMPGSAMLWATGGSSDQLQQQFDHVFNILAQRGYMT